MTEFFFYFFFTPIPLKNFYNSGDLVIALRQAAARGRYGDGKITPRGRGEANLPSNDIGPEMMLLALSVKIERRKGRARTEKLGQGF